MAIVISIPYARAGQEKSDVTLTLQLVDGSQLVGAPAVKTLRFKTSYTTFDLQLGLISRLEADHEHKTTRVFLTNGDMLRGEFTVRSLDVETILGKLTIPFEHISSISIRTADVREGLVVHYTFERISGNRIADNSGSGNDAFLRGSPVSGADYSPFLGFNGIDRYLECSDSPTLNMQASMSILFWMKPSSWGRGKSNGIVSKKKADNAPGYVLYNDGFHPPKLNFRIEGDAGSATMLHSRADVEVGSVQHWAVTYDAEGRVARLYKNGKVDTSYSPVSVGNMTNTMPLHIGHAQTWGGCFDGSLGNVMIFNRALSDQEVRMIYETQNQTE